MKVLEVTPVELLGPLTEAEVKHAPARLYAVGHLGLVRRAARVSVIGSRVASEQGLRRARRLGGMLAGRGVVLVSGLAQGIDAAAHAAALDAGGRTVAVLATALDRAYPKEHVELQRRLAREQLVVSQFPVGTKTQPDHFPERNRTLALLADVTVIMEAGDDSLSLNQGLESLRLGRPLFVARSLTLNPALAWPAKFLGLGAHVLDKDSIDELYARLPDRGDPDDTTV